MAVRAAEKPKKITKKEKLIYKNKFKICLFFVFVWAAAWIALLALRAINMSLGIFALVCVVIFLPVIFFIMRVADGDGRKGNKK
jgi:hypothetical protein